MKLPGCCVGDFSCFPTATFLIFFIVSLYNESVGGSDVASYYIYSVHAEVSRKSNAELLRNQMANILRVGGLCTC